MTLVGTTTCHGSLLWMRSNASVITHSKLLQIITNITNMTQIYLRACFLEVGQVLSNNLLCKPCGRCKWLQKLPFPPQQQVQWVNKRAFTNTSFHERCHWQSFCISESLAHQLLHFPIRDNLLRIRHLHMLLVRNTKTSLTCKLIALHQLYMVLRKPILHISAILKFTNFGSFSANPWHISDSCNFSPFICKAHLAPPRQEGSECKATSLHFHPAGGKGVNYVNHWEPMPDRRFARDISSVIYTNFSSISNTSFW